MRIATPSTLAARHIASSKPANATRNRATRRGLQSPLDYEIWTSWTGPPIGRTTIGSARLWTDWFRSVDRLVHYWARCCHDPSAPNRYPVVDAAIAANRHRFTALPGRKCQNLTQSLPNRGTIDSLILPQQAQYELESACVGFGYNERIGKRFVVDFVFAIG